MIFDLAAIAARLHELPAGATAVATLAHAAAVAVTAAPVPKDAVQAEPLVRVPRDPDAAVAGLARPVVEATIGLSVFTVSAEDARRAAGRIRADAHAPAVRDERVRIGLLLAACRLHMAANRAEAAVQEAREIAAREPRGRA